MARQILNGFKLNNVWSFQETTKKKILNFGRLSSFTFIFFILIQSFRLRITRICFLVWSASFGSSKTWQTSIACANVFILWLSPLLILHLFGSIHPRVGYLRILEQNSQARYHDEYKKLQKTRNGSTKQPSDWWLKIEIEIIHRIIK